MKALTRNCLLVLLMMALFVVLAWFFSLTPEGILYGRWPENDDHPANWQDTALHPNAQ